MIAIEQRHDVAEIEDGFSCCIVMMRARTRTLGKRFSEVFRCDQTRVVDRSSRSVRQNQNGVFYLRGFAKAAEPVLATIPIEYRICSGISA
jgi:hypothetical protein